MKTKDWTQLGTTIARWRRRLDSGGLCREAQRRTALEDFGDPPLEPAFSILANSLEHEAELHPLGRFLMRVHLLDLLKTRLRLVDSWKSSSVQDMRAEAPNRHGEGGGQASRLSCARFSASGSSTLPRRARETPAAHSERRDTGSEVPSAGHVEKPIFIIGMPRSGSTFLHELLAEDPANRAPRAWEVMFPVAAPGGGEADRARRIRKARTCLWWFRRLAPQADAVYPMRACTPHECVAIHSYTFLSEEFVSTCRIPSYESFLRATDLRPAYVWQRRFLQHLQMDSPGRRWILKSPDHVHGLDALLSVFPDACIIQTHRNPIDVLKSSTHLTRVLRGLYGPPGEREEIRERETRLLAYCTERFIEFRDLHPELSDRIIDVKYRDLVSNPLGAVRRIYQQLGAPLPEPALERMRSLAAERSRYAGARYRARSAEFRLETGAVAAGFQRYCLRFGLPFNKAELGK